MRKNRSPPLSCHDLSASTYNINFSAGKKLLDSCYELKCYSIFVAKVREYLAEQQSLSQAIKNAIRYCRDNDLLAKYFAENEKEVFDMVTFKWDDKRANEIAREEGFIKGLAEGKEEGLAKGKEEAKNSVVLNMIKKSL